MHYVKLKLAAALVLLLNVAGLALTSTPAATGRDDSRTPDLPSPVCDTIQVPSGNNVAFHVYARGVQIYTWNGTAWTFVAPMATLYASPNYHGQVGTHYAGPTWESNSGSKVVGSRVAGCSPDPTAIPWLLLRAVSTQGPGIFGCVSFIQRVNTTGGLAPATPGSSVGETAEVPYTAEYYFYRAEH
ncbi:MAG TPA: DUF3455 domain-containing protein [Blastocatellia bacterium]|nr:DUF3455 domain-containing protein [Blastocatellia bacterium]